MQTTSIQARVDAITPVRKRARMHIRTNKHIGKCFRQVLATSAGTKTQSTVMGSQNVFVSNVATEILFLV